MRYSLVVQCSHARDIISSDCGLRNFWCHFMAASSLHDGIDECLRFSTKQERHQWYSDAAKYWEVLTL